MSQTLLTELDGALMIRYIKGITWAWHGGTYINAYDETGQCLATIGLDQNQFENATPALIEEILLDYLKK